MVRKDYIRIATTIRKTSIVHNHGADMDTIMTLASNLAFTFADDNPRFKRAYFMQACGFDGDL